MRSRVSVLAPLPPLHRFAALARAVLLLAVLALAVSPAFAATWYVGPAGTPRGDGSQAAPFASIDAAFASGQVVGGDTLMLLDGSYGEVIIRGVAPATPVTIQGANPGKAVFESIEVTRGARNLTFAQVAVIWTKEPAKTRLGWLFHASPDTAAISITDSTLMAHPTGAEYRAWTLADWTARKISGINLRSGGGQVLRNRVIGVAFGITVEGSDVLVEGNTVDGFSHDGLRGNGNRLTFRGNRVTNCVQINGNHADAFQSFNLARDGSTFDGMLIEGNTFIEQTDPVRMPLACALQGVGMFDGFFSNLVIRNNVIEVSAFHGISVYGVTGVTIDRNTVVQTPGGKNRPWIAVWHHKDKRVSSGVTILSNVASAGVVGPFAPGVNNVLPGAVPGAAIRPAATPCGP